MDHQAFDTLEFDSLLIHPNRMETELALLTGKATVAHGSTNQFDFATSEVTLHMVLPQTTTVETAVDGVVVEATEGAQVVERGAWFGVLLCRVALIGLVCLL